MPINKPKTCLAIALFVAIAASVCSGASTRIWDGHGGVDNNMNTPSNWTTNVVPVAGDAIQFSASAVSNVNNNIAAATSFTTMTFNAGAGAYTISGNSIKLTGITNNSANLQTVNTDIALTAAFAVNTATGDLALGGIISAAFGLTKTGPNTLTLSGLNTYTGQTQIQAGTVSINSIANKSSACALGAPTTTANGTIALGSGGTSGTLVYTGGVGTTNRVINLAGTTGGGVIDQSGSGTLTFSSASTATGAGSKTLTLQGSTGSGGALSGKIIDNSGVNITSVVKSGTGTWTLSGGSTYTGSTTVNAGKLAAGKTVNSFGTNSAVVMGTAATAVLDITGFSNTIGSLTGGNATGGGVTLGAATLTVGNDNTSPAAYNGIISGTGKIVKSGTGTIILGGLNTYTGTTTIQNGALSVNTILTVNGGPSSLGAPTTAANGTIALGATTTTGMLVYTGGAQSTDRVINLAGTTGGGTIDQSGSGTLTFSSNLTATGGGIKILTLQGSTAFGGVLSGKIIDNSGVNKTSVVKAGTGTWTLSSTISSYTGTTSVQNGTLSISSIQKVGAGNSSVGNPALAQATIILGSATTAGTLAYTGGAFSTDRVIDLSGTTGGGTVDQSSATGVLTFSSDLTASGAGIKTFTLQGSTAFGGVVSGKIVDNGGANTTALAKTGSGIWTLSNANTFTGGTTLNNGTLNLNNASSLSSGTFLINGGAIDNTTLGSITLNNNIQTWAGNFSFAGTQPLNLGAGDVSLTADPVVTIGGSTLTEGGNISGAHALTKAGAGTLVLTGNNSYTGTTSVQNGTLSISAVNDVSGGSSSIGAPTTALNGTISMGNGTNTGVLLYTGAGSTTNRVINLAGSTGGATIDQSGASGLLKFTSDLTAVAGSKALTLQGSTGGTGEFSGAIVDGSGTTALTKAGTGTWTLSGANSYTGATAINNGTLFVTGSTASGSAVAVNAGGTLGGTGTVNGTINMSVNGTIAPGTGGTTIGTLYTNDVNMNATSDYSVDLDGTGLAADLLSAAGKTVTLAGNLVVASNAHPGSGNVYTIVTAGTVSSTFSGLPNGSTFSGGSRSYQIAYTGTTVTLTDVVHTPTRTWDGGGSDDNWLTNINWDLDQLPTTGDYLVFAGNTRLTPNNNYTAGTEFSTISFSSGAGNFVIGGNAVALSGGASAITSNATSGTMTLNNNITFSTAAPTITSTAGGTLVIGGTVDNGGLLVSGNIGGPTTMSKAISGTGGFTKSGAGTLTFSGTTANTYGGVTTVGAGTLLLQKTAGIDAVPGAITLGDASGSDVVDLGASNQINDASIVTFNSGSAGNSGKLQLDGYNETVGGIQSNAGQASVIQNTEGGAPAGPNSPAVLTVNNTSDYIYDGMIRNTNSGSGTLGLTKSGAGTLTLRCGIDPTLITFTGATTVSAGTLVIDNLSNWTSAITNNSAAADALTFSQGATSLSTSAVVSGSGGVTKTGNGTLTLAGTNTYTGATSIQNGTLSISTIKDVSGGSSSIGAPTSTSNGTIAMGSTSNTGTLVYTGAGNATNRVINLAGSTGGATIDQSGTGLLKFTSSNTAAAGAKTLTLQGSTAGTGEFGAAIINSSGTVSVTKLGTSAWTLSGVNTYTGSTNINNGTLIVTGSLAAGSAVTVASGATLSGAGTLAGPVSVLASGIVAPGNGGAGTINTGALTIDNAAVLNFELAAPAGTSDKIAVTGDLSLGGTINITPIAGFAAGAFTIMTYSGNLSGGGITIGSIPATYGGVVAAGGGKVTLTISSVVDPAWTRTSLGAVNGGSITSTNLCFGTGPGTNAMVSLNLASGATLWSYATGAPCGMPTYMFTGAAYKYVATAGNFLVGVQDGGSELWAPRDLGATPGNPYVSPDDTSICVLYGTSLSRRKLSDGLTEIAAGFPVTIANASTSADMVAFNDEVYVASTAGMVTKLDYDGTPVSTWTAPDRGGGSPGVYLPLIAASISDSLLYVFPFDNAAYSVKTSTMLTNWTCTYNASDTNCGPPFIPFDGNTRSGTVYCAAGKKIYKLTEGLAHETWTYTATDSCFSGPLVYNGKVYFGTKDSSYSAVTDNGGSATIIAKWPYPSSSGNASTGPLIDPQSSMFYFGTTGGRVDAFPLQ